MKVLVCGGRRYASRRTVDSVLRAFDAVEHIDIVVHGDAPGADTLAKSWALHANRVACSYPANWAAHGNAAGPIRNREMWHAEKESLHALIAFPGGTGTENMLTTALEDLARHPRDIAVIRVVDGVPYRMVWLYPNPDEA